jgi:hypothetical protein
MCAVASMAVYFSSLISCFPRMLLRYFLNYFEVVPVAPIITGIISGAFVKLPKATVTFMPVRPFFHMEQHGSHRIDCHQI